MFYRFSYLSLLLYLVFSSSVYGDTLRLTNFDEEIDAKIVEVSEEFVEVIIPQKEIGSISMKSELPVRPTGGGRQGKSLAQTAPSASLRPLKGPTSGSKLTGHQGGPKSSIFLPLTSNLYE
ncbi:MAG: hypothetical protein JYX80_13415 [Candidatus Scalindua sediminis]|nr:hypothetical protein [Candidatus Scalindua sediminis]